ncbi:MAG TPA: thioredoxin domain-containing protein [Nocardioidaceae bacterium]|nr:thioredoxin domain-containing protein [Nocardioidaceae bacterium]
MSSKKSKATQRSNAGRAAERAAAIRAEQERSERRRRAVIVGAVVLVVIAVVVGIGIAVQSGRDTTGQVATPPSGTVDQYAVPFGEADAPVTVGIYEDFMCPFCGQFEAASGDQLEKYVADGDVQVQYHVVSFLDRASNGTDYSTRAMNAFGVVLDVAGPQTAKKFHDLLYENQPEENSDGLSDEELIDLAVQAGAPREQVAGPIESGKFEQWVANATEAASQAGVTGTPTVMVDGEQVQGATIGELVDAMQTRIEESLQG